MCNVTQMLRTAGRRWREHETARKGKVIGYKFWALTSGERHRRRSIVDWFVRRIITANEEEISAHVFHVRSC